MLEGVAFTLAEGMEVLAARGAPLAPLVAISGGARSPAWMRLVAAALDLPVATVHGGEVGSALGAARLARVAAGDGTADVNVAGEDFLAGMRKMMQQHGAELGASL